MKKMLLVLLATLMVLQGAFSLVGCSKFEGSAEHFKQSGSFYSDVYGLIGSVFGGSDTYYNIFDENGSAFDLAVDINNYKLNNLLVKEGKGNALLSAVISPDLDIKGNVSLDAFEEKTNMDFSLVGNDMLLQFDSKNKPFYYKETDEKTGMVKSAASFLQGAVENATFKSSREAYKFKGVNFDADTVELSLNSDSVSELANNITRLLIDTPNLALNEMYFPIQEIVYTIQNEKLHISWKRYLEDEELCRETFKVYDNYNHYYILDIAYAESGKNSYAEISLKANNGDMVLTVFTLSVEKEDKDNNSFSTLAKLIVGDELYITAGNSGTASEAKGEAKINFVTEIGEVSLPLEYSYISKDVDGKKEQVYNFSLNNVFASFDISVKLTTKDESEPVSIKEPEEYFDVTILEDIYDYSYSASPLFKSAIKNAFRLMQGKEAIAPEVMPTDDPYTIDISFDTGDKFETNGEYGKDYVNLLLSDQYTFKYYSYEDSQGLMKTQSVEYFENGEKITNYSYSDGSKYTQLLKDYTKYEVRYDVEKIIYSEYDKADYESTYPDPQYQYYQSGKCLYDERELVYERYFSNVHNYYTFVFNEDGEVEIIILYSETEDSTLYMFVEELSNVVPEEAFELPDYEKVSVHDYFE